MVQRRAQGGGGGGRGTTPPRSGKVATLGRRGEIAAVRRDGRSLACSHFVVFYLPRAQLPSRIVLSVSRRLGNAVVRNRMRRQLKEIFRVLLPRLVAPQDLMIIVRAPAVGTSLKTMAAQLERLFARRRLLEVTGSSSPEVSPEDSTPSGATTAPVWTTTTRPSGVFLAPRGRADFAGSPERRC